MSNGDLGFDFSHYQGSINFGSARAAGFKYCFGKVTEGDSNTDSNWTTNRAHALDAGLPVGGYHWMHPNTDPVECAREFKAALNWKSGMLPAVLDAEHNGSASGPTGAGGMSATHIHNWIHSFQDALAMPLVIYTGDWFWSVYVEPAAAGCARCAALPLWLSRYADSIGRIPKPWTSAAAWQFTETGHVSGIAGLVDEDYLESLNLQQLLDYANGGSSTHDPGGDELTKDDLASIEHLIESHNASLKSWLNGQIHELYTSLARAEFDGKESEAHLPMSIKGARDDVITAVRKVGDKLGVKV